MKVRVAQMGETTLAASPAAFGKLIAGVMGKGDPGGKYQAGIGPINIVPKFNTFSSAIPTV
jgi:hypothetical protein